MYLKNILFKRVLKFATTKQTNSNQIIQTNKNLINPTPNDPVAFGYFFPKQWNQQKIYEQLDPTRKQIVSVKTITNKFGNASGKVLFEFKNMNVMKKYIDRYSQDFIQTQDSVHRVVIKKFDLKTQKKKREKNQFNKKYGVHLVNLDFDIDHPELERLAQDFGEIQYIDLPIKDNGLNRGSSKIYFKNRQSMLDFQLFSDGLKYKDRKLKCSIIKSEHQIQKDRQIKEVHDPKIVMKWNEDLYKRMVKKEAESYRTIRKETLKNQEKEDYAQQQNLKEKNTNQNTKQQQKLKQKAENKIF